MTRHFRLIATALLLAVPCIEAMEHFSTGTRVLLALGLGFVTAVVLVLLTNENDP